MTLLSVTETEGKLSAEFKLSNGKTVSLTEDKLDESEKPRLQEKLKEQTENVEAPEKEAAATTEDVIYPVIKDLVVAADRKDFKPLTEFSAPEKYYLFYSTASWCPPCQKFTPDLVKFHKKYKKSHGEIFEIILLTSDKEEEQQIEYSNDKKMTWPQLKIGDVGRIKSKFKIPGGGIPSLTLTDITGKIILSPKDGYAREVMDKFEDILKDEE